MWFSIAFPSLPPLGSSPKGLKDTTDYQSIIDDKKGSIVPLIDHECTESTPDLITAPEEDAKERLRAKKTHFLSEGGCPANSDHGAIMARILERRINMAYDNEDENGSSESDNASTATFDSDDQANELDHATKANNPHPYISQ